MLQVETNGTATKVPDPNVVVFDKKKPPPLTEAASSKSIY